MSETESSGWRELKSATRNPNIQEAMAAQPAISEPNPPRAQAEPEYGPGTQAAEEHVARSKRKRR
jgi:hypothetical protein